MRRLLSLVLAASLALGTFAVPAPAQASSIGPCASTSTGNYDSVETTGSGDVYGIEAVINPPNSFGMCEPSDGGADQNASVAQIAIIQGETHDFLTLGIVMCDDGNFVGPAFCKGYPGQLRFFGEVNACTLTIGDHQWDFGPADFGAHTFRLNFVNGNSPHWNWVIDGVTVKKIWVTGGYTVSYGCLDPRGAGRTTKGQFGVETKDPGDGLGTNDNPLKIRYPKLSINDAAYSTYNVGSTWSSCSNQHECVVDDPGNILYAWTAN